MSSLNLTRYLRKNFIDALNLDEDCVKVDTEEKNVINNGVATGHNIGFIEVKIFCFGD